MKHCYGDLITDHYINSKIIKVEYKQRHKHNYFNSIVIFDQFIDDQTPFDMNLINFLRKQDDSLIVIWDDDEEYDKPLDEYLEDKKITELNEAEINFIFDDLKKRVWLGEIHFYNQGIIQEWPNF